MTKNKPSGRMEMGQTNYCMSMQSLLIVDGTIMSNGHTGTK